MSKCKQASIVYGASSVLWGILGIYVSSVFAIDIIAELHTNSALFVGLDILLVLCGIALLISAVMLWSQIRHFWKIACIISLVSSFVILMNYVWLAVANPLLPLDTWITILVPLVSTLLSILSLACLPPQNSK